MDFSLFQAHTVHLYNLESHPYVIKTIKARQLLSPFRFDLFAKLFYARHRDQEPELAREVYIKHINAFNPDGREPGRDDKTSFEDFIKTYDDLLDYFKERDFDSTKSIVPVSSDGTILDGGHRVAALAFYDKDITIAIFENVIPVCQFDYNYFKQRGLSQNICDIIAREIFYWIPNCFVACLWPRMGTDHQKQHAQGLLNQFALPFYYKSFDVTLNSLTLFIAEIYRRQPWVGAEANHFAGAKDKALNCYTKGNTLDLYFFATSKSLEDILQMKEEIRSFYPYEKHSIHITDNHEETDDIAFFSLTQQGIERWAYAGNWKGWQLIKQNVIERIYIFRHTRWVEFKVYVASLLNGLIGK